MGSCNLLAFSHRSCSLSLSLFRLYSFWPQLDFGITLFGPRKVQRTVGHWSVEDFVPQVGSPKNSPTKPQDQDQLHMVFKPWTYLQVSTQNQPISNTQTAGFAQNSIHSFDGPFHHGRLGGPKPWQPWPGIQPWMLGC